MKIYLHVHGCKTNQYDAEAIRELLEGRGYVFTSVPSDADAFMLQTCAVTGEAERKARQFISRCARLHPGAPIIVTGCYAQNSAADILKMEGVKLVAGNAGRAEIADRIEDLLGPAQDIVRDIAGEHEYERLFITRFEGHTRALIKIQEGCDRRCSYCLINRARGPSRSRPLEDISREAATLYAAGYKEIVLTGIHLADYGRHEGLCLADAAEAVYTAAPVRIRLGSLEPLCVDEDGLRRLAAVPGVCPQFHIALQSGSDGILRAMRRGYTSGAFRDYVALVRRYFPRAAITTDIIAGFPGETEADHEATLSFIRSIGFARVHAFPFSPRKGTDAASMKEQITEKVKKRRTNEIIALGHETERIFAESFIGDTAEVLLETPVPGGFEGYSGRYQRVITDGGEPGSVVRVLLKKYENSAFYGEITEQDGAKNG